jgi:hypothetical protein
MALDLFSSRSSTTSNTNLQDSNNRTVTITSGYTDVGNVKLDFGPKPGAAGFTTKELIPLVLIGAVGFLVFKQFRN